MGAGEQSYRLYSCRRCAQQVRICRHCDRGHQYCAADCARVRRRESLRRAGVRYQLSYHGACRHAARQRRWRARQLQKVTHHASLQAGAVVIVTATAITTASNDADHAATVTPSPADTVARVAAFRVQAPACCCFCGRRLSRFARIGPLRGGP
jgi:hypothetical protein